MPSAYIHLPNQFDNIAVLNVLGTKRDLRIAYDEGQAIAREVLVEIIHVDATVQIDVAVYNLGLEEQRNAR
jgi:hypothetical protein